MKRLRVLHANGKSRRLIGDLLKDATTWINLRRGHRGQVDTLRNFSKGYQNKVYNEQASYLVAGIVQEFSSTIQSRFDKFDEDSSALIQLVSLTTTCHMICRFLHPPTGKTERDNITDSHPGIQLDIYQGITEIEFVKHKHEAAELDYGKPKMGILSNRSNFLVCFSSSHLRFGT